MEGKGFDVGRCKELVEDIFMKSALPSLGKFIEIDNVTKFYYNDRTPEEWSEGYDKLLKAANHIKNWVEELKVIGCKVEIKMEKENDRTPVIITTVQASGVGDNKDDTIVFYGHYDKQPPLAEQLWTNGRKPYVPSLEPPENPTKLYGRGGADDGYSTYGTMIAIKILQDQKIAHPRFVMITEGDEESGTGDVEYWMDKLQKDFGKPKMVFCLDSGTVDYERFWLTTSLRGSASLIFQLRVLEQAIHSGDGTGRVPTCGRILRKLLSRIQNIDTGQIPLLDVKVPEERMKEIQDLVKEFGEEALLKLKTIPGLERPLPGVIDTILFGTWRAGLEIIGLEGYPLVKDATNAIIPAIKTKISVRLPPTLQAEKGRQVLMQHLTKNIPHNAKITFDEKEVVSRDGFSAPEYGKELISVMEEASRSYFEGKKYLGTGDGGSIPFMDFLNKKWPQAKFIVTGILGPDSNAHGPNEYLHIPYLKKVICTIAHILGRSIPILFPSEA